MNYNKLWKLLIDRNLLQKDLRVQTGISTNALAKMKKGGDVSTQVLRKICTFFRYQIMVFRQRDVSTQVLRKICTALDCKIEDVVEIEYEKS